MAHEADLLLSKSCLKAVAPEHNVAMLVYAASMAGQVSCNSESMLDSLARQQQRDVCTLWALLAYTASLVRLMPQACLLLARAVCQ